MFEQVIKVVGEWSDNISQAMGNCQVSFLAQSEWAIRGDRSHVAPMLRGDVNPRSSPTEP